MNATGQNHHSLGGDGQLGERPVKRIGFGVMQLERASVDPATARAILQQAAEAGVDHFDTAQFYGHCNELLADALGDRRAQLAYATKVGATRDPDYRLIPGQKPAELRAQVEENLAALRTDHLELVNLRRLDHAPGILADGDQLVDMDDQLAELIALRDAGTIGAIGLSNVSAEQLSAGLPAGIACVQNFHSLLNRESEPVLELCREHGIAWAPYMPLGSAFPDRPKVHENPTVTALAAELGATPAQVGLAWLLAIYSGTLLIPGTASPEHLEENLGAGDLVLSPEVLARLNAVA